jgi:hypothetical protein
MARNGIKTIVSLALLALIMSSLAGCLDSANRRGDLPDPRMAGTAKNVDKAQK